jgi:hypothetical protein
MDVMQKLNSLKETYLTPVAYAAAGLCTVGAAGAVAHIALNELVSRGLLTLGKPLRFVVSGTVGVVAGLPLLVKAEKAWLSSAKSEKGIIQYFDDRKSYILKSNSPTDRLFKAEDFESLLGQEIEDKTVVRMVSNNDLKKTDKLPGGTLVLIEKDLGCPFIYASLDGEVIIDFESGTATRKASWKKNGQTREKEVTTVYLPYSKASLPK